MVEAAYPVDPILVSTIEESEEETEQEQEEKEERQSKKDYDEESSDGEYEDNLVKNTRDNDE